MRKKTKFRHSSKIKDDIDLIKIEVRDNQFLIEKIIDAVEKNNPFVMENPWNYAWNRKRLQAV